uniref:Calcium-binding shell glycoprotein P95 (Fragments) n=1 Tax=Unio pictorum TaxID=55837 RepID=CBG95_UNIPI|nr:RecName: Full=Calcium-binding shell glycoprotein P95 [Unio pictorum]
TSHGGGKAGKSKLLDVNY